MEESETAHHFPTYGPPPPGWAAAGAEASSPARAAKDRRFRRRVVTMSCVVAAGAGVGLGATALAGAASPSTTSPPSSSSPPSSPPLVRPGLRGPFRLGGPALFGLGPGIGGSVVHGQYTIKGPKGYETIDERTGTVQSVSNTSGTTWSLTVKSADGTTGTFTVDSSTSVDGGESGISSVKTGDSVMVVGTVSGSTTTATQITDQTILKANGQSWLPMPPKPATANASTSGVGGGGTGWMPS
jgi:hypothetical protein